MTSPACMGSVRPGRFVDYYGARLFVPLGHFDEAHMLSGGRPEQHVLTAFSRVVQMGDVVVDVGANIGTHSFALASMVGPAGRVYAVEADIDNAASLRASIVESGAANVHLLPVAASDASGLIRALSSEATNTAFSAAADRNSAKVAVALALDDVIAERVALIKIDVEGAELLALRGLARTIDRSRPVVLSEFSPAYIEANLGRDRSDEFFAFFVERDYTCFVLDPVSGFQPIADYEALLAAQRDAIERLSWNHVDILFAPRGSPLGGEPVASTKGAVSAGPPEPSNLADDAGSRATEAAHDAMSIRQRGQKMPISAQATLWGMRLLLGREPDGEAALAEQRDRFEDLDSFRASLLRTPEARALFRDANRDGDAARDPYSMPLFLLRRPIQPGVPWRFAEPSLEHPVSQLCTAEQMDSPVYTDACRRLGLDPHAPHRKIWEFVFILRVLDGKGLLSPGRRGLGFGTGREPLPSAFAKAGVHVTATDAPADLDFSEAWSRTDQWTQSLEDLWHPDLVGRAAFFDRVTFRAADMNRIPQDLTGFDFCWSACCLEHLGSIRAGLDYIHRSLDTLKPGGVSVQTTEFNLLSNETTIEEPSLCLFRKRDIELVVEELVREGHTVEPLNLWPGATPVDEHIDVPPYSVPHLKLRLEGYPTTSLGLVITKRS